MQRFFRLTAVISAALFAFCGTPGISSGWKTSAPAEQGLDSKTLARMNSHALATLPHIRSLLIARHGCLVFEEYYNGGSPDELQNIQSMTKSVTGALIGIAIRQGRIRVNQKVMEFFPEIESPPDPRVRAVTIRHLLTMSSGIRADPPQWDKNDDNPARSALTQTLDADPGAKFIYSGYAQHILSAILCRVTHQTVLDFAEVNLFRPLGMSKVVWYKDKNGLELGCGSSLWKTTDLLKFGQLYLNRGRWNGAELIPEWYVSESTKTHCTGDFFGTRISYGFLWFTDTISGHGVYYARGYGGQYLLVAPDLDLVVLCTSDWRQPEYPEHYALVKDFVIPSVIEPQSRH
jgi:CubicO group peptidase (beta-lactamase class C family)